MEIGVKACDCGRRDLTSVSRVSPFPVNSTALVGVKSPTCCVQDPNCRRQSMQAWKLLAPSAIANRTHQHPRELLAPLSKAINNVLSFKRLRSETFKQLD